MSSPFSFNPSATPFHPSSSRSSSSSGYSSDGQVHMPYPSPNYVYRRANEGAVYYQQETVYYPVGSCDAGYSEEYCEEDREETMQVIPEGECPFPEGSSADEAFCLPKEGDRRLRDRDNKPILLPLRCSFLQVLRGPFSRLDLVDFTTDQEELALDYFLLQAEGIDNEDKLWDEFIFHQFTRNKTNDR